MANIFENARFGNKFRTRNGRMAVYYSRTLNKYGFVLIHQKIGDLNHACIYEVDCLGEVYHELDKGTDGLDIVGKWEEPIDEEELDRAFEEYIVIEREKCGFDKDVCKVISVDNVWLKEGFEAGYRKAKEL